MQSKTINQKWPDWLYVVRHGQSAGNVARDAAEGAGLPNIDIQERDVDVALSELGKRQAASLGEWVSQLPEHAQPNVIYTSPYLRAEETVRIALSGHEEFGEISAISDERLREREFGILDRLTKSGIIARYPDENQVRTRLGKFYYRPPGGESWCDVLLRLRSFLETVTRDYAGQRVMVVCHSVVMLCFRYLLERMSEKEILEIDRRHEIANCAVTIYQFDPSAGKHGKLLLRTFNHVAPLKAEGAPVTTKSDVSTN